MTKRLLTTCSVYRAVLAIVFFGITSAYAGVPGPDQSTAAPSLDRKAKNLIAQTPATDHIGPPVPEQSSSAQPSGPPLPPGPGAPGTIPPFTGPPVPGDASQSTLPPGPPPPSADTPVTGPSIPGDGAQPAGPPIATPPGQVAPGTMPVPQQTPKPPATPAPAAVHAQPRVAPAAGGSSFFFDDADVFEVIQTVFGEVLRVNYIVDPQVKGRVNFRTTTPIPKDKILSIMEIILRLNGIAVVEESGLYRVIPIGNIAKEPAPIRFGKDPDAIELRGTALLQLAPLTYINSSEMAAILTPLLTQGGAIYDISKKNILIIADTDANVRRLLQVVALFDVDTYKDASQPKVYVYPLQNTKAEHVAKILQQVMLGGSSTSTTTTVKTTTGGTASPSVPKAGPTTSQQPYTSGASGETLVAPSTKVIADDVNNSLVIFASPGDYAIILGAIKQIDTVPRQVMIEAVVARIDLTDNLTFGLKWNLNLDLNINPLNTVHGAHLLGPLGFQGVPAVPTGSFGYTAVDRGNTTRLAIEALAKENKAKILSAPHILVADNREAKIQVGQQIPLATSTTSTPITTTGTTATNTTTSTIQYKDVGTILKVKPQVNDSGLVALEISQEVSDFTPTDVLGTTQFIINKSEVTSNLIAQDGDTIVIGGLVNETIKYDRSGIPLVSKIPILGYLFGSTTDNNLRTEIVILLTPRVVRNQAEARKMTADYYELFQNVSKEVNLEKHKKRTSTPQQSSEKTTPAAKEKGDAKASPSVSQKNNGKNGQSEYPLRSDD